VTPCFLCGGPLEAGTGGELVGFAICAACVAALVAEADAPIDDELAAARDRKGARVTPGAGTDWCAGCGRPMPGPGSFRVIDGAPHCPACAPPGVPGTTCAACGEPGIGPLRSAHGFQLCAACLDSHPTLALAIARARHRRALAHLGRRLLDDGDD
jgi:hypothetical protein